MKRFLKISGLVVLFLLLAVISIPFLLESHIEKIVSDYAREYLQGELTFDSVDLSLISSFPKAEVTANALTITSHGAFKADTLLSSEQVWIKIPMSGLLSKRDQGINIESFGASNLTLAIKRNKGGEVNYQVLKEQNQNSSAKGTGEPANLRLNLNHYEINNSRLWYHDEESEVTLLLDSIDHHGDGNFSSGIFDLNTQTSAILSFEYGDQNYINQNAIQLDAVLEIDSDKSIYTFKNNRAYLNAMLLEFDGYIQLQEEGQFIDLSFENPQTSFAEFLAMIPHRYNQNVKDVESDGDFSLTGKIKGLYSDTTIPSMDIQMKTSNAAFKFPHLPKGIEQIQINASLKNTTGVLDDTFAQVNAFDFQIDEDRFKSSGTFEKLFTNPEISLQLEGSINLKNLSQAYPLNREQDLSGFLSGSLASRFDWAAVHSRNYGRIQQKGALRLKDFKFHPEELPQSLLIREAQLDFTNEKLKLNSFTGLTGQSDFKATGQIKNLIAYLFDEQTLYGNFKLNSEKLVISDFISFNESSQIPSDTVPLDYGSKIPKHLDFTVQASAKLVNYDQLKLQNVSGQLQVKEQSLSLNDCSMDIFGGTVLTNGQLKGTTPDPEFDFNLIFNNLKIAEAFQEIDLLKAIAPISKVLNGSFSSKMSIRGFLDDGFSPDLRSVFGNAQTELFIKEINLENSPLLASLNEQYSFFYPEEFNSKRIRNELTIENGRILVDSFSTSYKDVRIDISGSHGFDNSLRYIATFNVPAKYLGDRVNNLIRELDIPEAKAMTIPVKTEISGTFKDPTVNSDLSSGIEKFTSQLAELKKKQLLNNGKDATNSVLRRLLATGHEEVLRDSTKKDSMNDVSSAVNSLLKSLKNKPKAKTKKLDSVGND
jgi:hypothetical protein